MSVTQDYPDYQAYPVWRAAPYVAGLVHCATGSTTVAQGYITNFSSLEINLTCNSALGVDLTCTFYTDATLSHTAGVYNWVLGGLGAGGTILAVCVPALGNYFQLVAGNPNVASQTLNGLVGPVNVPVPGPRYQVNLNAGYQLGVSLGAGASTTANLADVAEGNGYFMVHSVTPAAPYSFKISGFDATNAEVLRVVERVSITGDINGVFLSPAYILQATLVNNDSVARTFDFYFQVIGN